MSNDMESINVRYRQGLASLSGNPDLPLDLYGVLFIWHPRPDALFGILKYPLQQLKMDMLSTLPVTAIESVDYMEPVEDQTYVANVVVSFMNAVKEHKDEWKGSVARFQEFLRNYEFHALEEEKRMIDILRNYEKERGQTNWSTDYEIFLKSEYRRKIAKERINTERKIETATKEFELLRETEASILIAKVSKLHQLEHGHKNCPWNGASMLPAQGEVPVIPPEELIKIALKGVY
jgi:hypothetical protein